MKKVILTTAAAFAMITAANAQQVNGVNESSTAAFRGGEFNLVINDYISIEPGNMFPAGQPTVTFNNPTEMAAGKETGTQTFTVNASRSFTVTISATPFVTDNPNPEVDNNIPANQIYSIESSNGTNGVVTNGSGNWQPVQDPSLGGTVVATSPNGGLNKQFDLQGKITPGFTYNMGGHYTSDVAIIAALD
jgi:hypothetical protein